MKARMKRDRTRRKDRLLNGLNRILEKTGADRTRNDTQNSGIRSSLEALAGMFQRHDQYCDIPEKTLHEVTGLSRRIHVFSGAGLADCVKQLSSHIKLYQAKEKGDDLDAIITS